MKKQEHKLPKKGKRMEKKQKTNKTDAMIRSMKMQNDALEVFLQKLKIDLSKHDNQVQDNENDKDT